MSADLRGFGVRTSIKAENRQRMLLCVGRLCTTVHADELGLVERTSGSTVVSSYKVGQSSDTRAEGNCL